jgi:hypothetical protein
MNPKFHDRDRVTYFDAVTRTVVHRGTVQGEGWDVMDEPGEDACLVYLVKAEGAPDSPVGAGVGVPWPESCMLHGWLSIDPDPDIPTREEFFEVLHLTRDPKASAGNGPDGARRDGLVARFDRYLSGR